MRRAVIKDGVGRGGASIWVRAARPFSAAVQRESRAVSPHAPVRTEGAMRIGGPLPNLRDEMAGREEGKNRALPKARGKSNISKADGGSGSGNEQRPERRREKRGVWPPRLREGFQGKRLLNGAGTANPSRGVRTAERLVGFTCR